MPTIRSQADIDRLVRSIQTDIADAVSPLKQRIEALEKQVADLRAALEALPKA